MARPDLIGITEAALVLDLSPQHVRNLIDAGKLPARLTMAAVLDLRAYREQHPDRRGRPSARVRLERQGVLV